MLFQCNVFIFENRTGYDINIAKENYLVALFRMVGLMNQRMSECGKMWTRITPNTDTFYAV